MKIDRDRLSRALTYFGAGLGCIGIGMVIGSLPLWAAGIAGLVTMFAGCWMAAKR